MPSRHIIKDLEKEALFFAQVRFTEVENSDGLYRTDKFFYFKICETKDCVEAYIAHTPQFNPNIEGTKSQLKAFWVRITISSRLIHNTIEAKNGDVSVNKNGRDPLYVVDHNITQEIEDYVQVCLGCANL